VTRDAFLATRMEWAGSSESRRRGLLGRDRLDPGEGIYLVPCQWIHMFGMRFAIDVVFLDATGRILCVQERLRPYRLSRLVLRAHGVLELPAGTIRLSRTRVGDQVDFGRA
jgi:uncharacterized membrane protein (UPF0127 family)